MERVVNDWIQANRGEISAIQRLLIEQSYAGQHGLFDYMKIHNILGGCIIEISKLQTQVNELKRALAEKQEKKGS